MAKVDTQRSGVYTPQERADGSIEYVYSYAPLPPDTRAPLIRFLSHNRDGYGRLERLASESQVKRTPEEQHAHQAIQTLLALQIHDTSGISVSNQAFMLLHLLGEQEQAASKAAFLQQHFGIGHIEAQLASIPLPDKLHLAYHLFLRATQIPSKDPRKPQQKRDRPSWLDMQILFAHEQLLQEGISPTASHIHMLFAQDTLSQKDIAKALRKLEALNEIVRLPARRRTWESKDKTKTKKNPLILPPHTLPHIIHP